MDFVLYSLNHTYISNKYTTCNPYNPHVTMTTTMNKRSNDFHMTFLASLWKVPVHVISISHNNYYAMGKKTRWRGYYVLRITSKSDARGEHIISNEEIVLSILSLSFSALKSLVFFRNYTFFLSLVRITSKNIAPEILYFRHYPAYCLYICHLQFNDSDKARSI